jgi:hypothetical protein
VQARDTELSGPPVPALSSSTASTSTKKDASSTSSKPQQTQSSNKPKTGKPGLEGVVVNRKRTKPSDVEPASKTNAPETKDSGPKSDKKEESAADTQKEVPKEEEGDRKRRRLE